MSDGPESWPAALESAVGACSVVRAATVLRETASTQDHARAMGAPPGTVVAAWRQTAGRGRLGRAWADTHDAGVAATFVLADGAPEVLAMRSAVAAASAVREFLPGDGCGIKWPNDVVADGRKLAGVLVERIDGRAFVGIGINVRRQAVPDDLRAHAVSLEDLGAHAPRIAALVALVRAVDRAWSADEASVEHAYRTLDRLTGNECSFRTPQGIVQGTVLRVDPRQGLAVATADGEVYLAAATTSVVPPAAGSRYGSRDAPRP